MNEKVLRVLEFDKIIAQLTEHAGSVPGKALCKALVPMDHLSDIQRSLDETEAAIGIIFKNGNISFGNNRDFSFIFSALTIGRTLSPADLLHLQSFLENVGRVRSYGMEGIGEENVLYDLFDCLDPLRPLSREIGRCILSEEEIADDASSALRKVRREIGMTGDRIHQQLNKMVNVTFSSYLQDSVITMRGDRYCIPVKAEHKGQVPGIVHDQSSSGSTLFIEPAAVVNLNNQLRELLIQEKKEEEKVLAELSEMASANLMGLRDNAANMTSLDFIFARAKLALDMNASKPVMGSGRHIRIRKGRHPLIDRKTVVPIDRELGDLYDMIVITGPNTGGKTVTLKTVGLFELMGMAGLHIPAGDQSELALFREIYADIGDEQSIEQSLSTFSSHMTQIVEILDQADDQCLCLFDELGAGTDPTEGAALAISILDYLHMQQVTTLATTHYSELKVYAMRTPGVTNASCEFDVETLRPTYRLLIGVPGRSNAFAISRKLGLPDYIIEAAREQLSQETRNFEDLLSDLEEKRMLIQRRQEEMERLEKSLSSREKVLADKEKHLDDRRQEILNRANQEARDILKDAKKTADEAISSLRRTGRGGSMADMERTRASLRSEIDKKNEKLQYKPEAPVSGKLKASELHVGDKVKVLSMGLTGIVTALPDKNGKVSLRCGIMQSKADLKDLELIKEDAFGNPVTKTPKSGVKRAFQGSSGSDQAKRGMNLDRGSSVSAELNLLGKTTDEAIMELDKYLDDARMSHLSSVRIVHGKGTGALRKAVQQYLRRQKWIKSYRAGDFGEGDAGVTIVNLH